MESSNTTLLVLAIKWEKKMKIQKRRKIALFPFVELFKNTKLRYIYIYNSTYLKKIKTKKRKG